MKIRVENISQGDDELLIKCKAETPLIKQIIALTEGADRKLPVTLDKKQYYISPANIQYLESVDSVTFVYTEEGVYTYAGSLAAFESLELSPMFFRCSKSMIINIQHIEHLKVLPGKRIDACLSNGEHVIISRHYAGDLKELLKGVHA